MECLQLSDLNQVKVRINLKGIIDQNKIIRNEIIPNSLHQIHFTLQLYTSGRSLGMTQFSNFLLKHNTFDQSTIFNFLYQDLSADAKIAISVISKKYNPAKPLGSTVIQLFDDKGELRQGKYHLFIWPDVLPDVQDPSTTPGLANDENIEMLNFISDRLEQCNLNNDNRAEMALKFKLSFIYRLVPAAFLEIQFPTFGLPVFYNDKVCVEYESTGMTSRNLGQLGSYLQILDYDYETQATNPLEDMYYTLKSQNETSSEKLIPSKQDIKEIDKIASNNVKIQVKGAEKELFYNFRHFLVQDKKYLAYFLNSLSPQYNDEIQLQKLLNKWQKIDQADALYLLSKEFSLNTIYNKKKLSLPILKIIRDYAVMILSQLKDQQITYNLLFLIQALRYEGDTVKSTLLDLIIHRSSSNQQIASLVFWYLKTQSQSIQGKDAKVSKQTQKNIKLYQQLFGQFYLHVKEKNPTVKSMLEKQNTFFQHLKKIAKIVKQAKDKKGQLRKKLSEIDWQIFEGGIPYPMDVEIILKQPIIQECTVFSSAMAPCKLTFQTIGFQKFTFLFKSGDDLRQDQMILEMFYLMDRLLKDVNQDYRLTPYKALACSRSDGFVQFVPETRTFQETNLKQYLNALMRQNPNVMENYVFSCAGYCAITYFFGIGDRHLENLLISSQGKMLHIDFGFILGRDPKPYPPPIKIRKDMIDSMGGIEHDNFKIFKAKCLLAFLYLRKHSKIVYNLVFLMLDSGLKDVHNEGLSKLYDKFAVEMNDTEAEKHFLMVLEECKNAIAALLADKIHRWASHFR